MRSARNPPRQPNTMSAAAIRPRAYVLSFRCSLLGAMRSPQGMGLGSAGARSTKSTISAGAHGRTRKDRSMCAHARGAHAQRKVGTGTRSTLSACSTCSTSASAPPRATMHCLRRLYVLLSALVASTLSATVLQLLTGDPSTVHGEHPAHPAVACRTTGFGSVHKRARPTLPCHRERMHCKFTRKSSLFSS